MTPTLIIICVFVCVAALVGGVAMVLLGKSSNEVEERLDLFTSGGSGSARDKAEKLQLLTHDLDQARGLLDDFVGNLFDLRRFLAQADLKMTPGQFVLLTFGLGASGVLIVMFTSIPYFFAPILAIVLAALPFLLVVFKRKRRVSLFAEQLPDALELISRALRAGHSLASGFSLVGEEMADPIRTEFTRCYEEQNLGVPLEEALEGMTERVPNLDLRFFATVTDFNNFCTFFDN